MQACINHSPAMSAFLHAPRFAFTHHCNRFVQSTISSRTRPQKLVPIIRAMATRITPPAVKDRLNTEAPPLYIDVRTPKEFAEGHVPKAVNVPVTLGGGVVVPSFVEDVRTVTSSEQTLIFGCKSGKRSAMAIEVLQKAGFEGLLEMEGGFDAWLASADLPVEI